MRELDCKFINEHRRTCSGINISYRLKKYDNVGNFSDGLAKVKLDDKWVFIDKTGKKVLPIK